MNQPHGGTLINRVNLQYDYSSILMEIEIDRFALSDLELIAIGAYSPIIGFLGENDYYAVINRMRLTDGHIWSIPITLPVTEYVADSLKIGDKIKLVYKGKVYGILELQEKYFSDKRLEAEQVYGTTDDKHWR